MSIEVRNLERLRVYEEAAGSSTFAVDHSGTPNDFLDLHFQEGSVSANKQREMLDPQCAQQLKDAMTEKVLGRKRSTLGWTSLMASHGVTIDGNTAAPTNATWAMARVMKAIMGGEQTETSPAAGTSVVSTTSNSVFDITTGHGTRFTPGSGIALVIGGKLECRVVEAVSTDEITVKVAFSATPTGTVYGSVTHYMTELPSTSLQFMLEGADSEDRYLFSGMQGGFGITIEPGQLPTIAPSLNGATWAKLASGSLSNVTYSNFSPSAVVDSEFIVGTVGSATLATVDVQSTSWAPNIGFTEVTSPAGVNNIAAWVRARQVPLLSGSFNPFRDGAGTDWESYRDNRTDLALFQQIGSSAGSAVLLEAPTVQVVDVQDGDNNGLDAFTVNWEARTDAEIGSTSELSYSAFRVHWF